MSTASHPFPEEDRGGWLRCARLWPCPPTPLGHLSDYSGSPPPLEEEVPVGEGGKLGLGAPGVFRPLRE